MVDRADNLLAEGAVVGVDAQGRLVLRSESGIETAISSGEAHLV
jgi:BirA family biotin operon repressor/biotin-[acetyl-CoA-carboxylase] ligase